MERQRIDSKEPPLDSKECQDELVQASHLMTELQIELDQVSFL